MNSTILLITFLQITPTGTQISMSHLQMPSKQACEMSGQLIADVQVRRAAKIAEDLGFESKFKARWECI